MNQKFAYVAIFFCVVTSCFVSGWVLMFAIDYTKPTTVSDTCIYREVFEKCIVGRTEVTACQRASYNISLRNREEVKQECSR